MNGLHFDNDVPHRLAAYLEAFGFDVVLPHALGLTAASDAAHLSAAFGAGRTRVTHNTDDFMTLHTAWIECRRAWSLPAAHHGILVLEQYGQSQNAAVGERLIAAFRSH